MKNPVPIIIVPYYCILSFKKTMEHVGCTTPFGLNIDHICLNHNKSMKALELFKSLVDKSVTIKECPYSCTITKSYTKPGQPRLWYPWQLVVLDFDKFIKITKARYSYTELELLAEIGGYVGLFLGLSVFDFSKIFNKICEHLM